MNRSKKGKTVTIKDIFCKIDKKNFFNSIKSKFLKLKFKLEW